MKVAVISDVHSNLEALTAVVEDAKKRGAEQLWCLGDVVGYNADPDQCCEIVKDRCSIAIMGNHDSAVVGNTEPSHFNRVAKEAVMWSRKVLKRSNMEFLKRLRSAVVFDDTVLIVHGAPSDPDRYILSEEAAKSELLYMVRNLKRKVCFFGHTHFPLAYKIGPDGKFSSYRGEGSITLEEDSSYLVNPGSTGQPRDGDVRASYVMFDRDKMVVTWVRAPYDIKTCQEKIMTAGLPPFLAERLEAGY
ncbi:MAG: metallophosphoesterase [Deltaproteobacteria bacterium]|nr:metallophosphoesterase [Deltaproteobacteria bacterium]NIS77485.1 metallophosphoesterase [Deltaproteobacteria bacterium]